MNNTIKSDEVDLSANVYTRSGDPGRTLYSDRHAETVQPARRIPGPAEPNNQPCSCRLFTFRRGTAGTAHCYVCGGLELVTEPRAKS